MNEQDRELLVRIDERTNSFHQSLARIELTLINKVDNDQSFKDMRDQVTTMWDLKNRAMGIIAAWTAFIAIGAAVAVEYVKSTFFK
jgi:hypothetical protein